MDWITRRQQPDYGICRGLTYALRGRYRFLRFCPIGRSQAGRSIDALQLGDGPEEILLTAAIHAQERITALILLRLCEEICAGLDKGATLSDIDVRAALRARRIWMIPLCNPDGAEIAARGAQGAGPYAPLVRQTAGEFPEFWQANARGVDLNHNFNAGWKQLQKMECQAGICGPSPRQWGGPQPESESETRALVRLCRSREFRHIVCLHTQGEEIYWEYGEKTPPQAALMAQIAASVSGYRAAQPQGLAGHGGFKDWFIEQTGRAGFTVEMGRGQNPLPIEQFEEIYQKAKEMLLLFALAM